MWSMKHGKDAAKAAKGGGGLKKLVSLVSAALAVAAVVKELRTPPDERTWNGKVAAVVPYDFRSPTIARIRERLWNPKGEHLISPRVFGVGWTVNFGKVVAMAREKFAGARQ
jgi:hypothetical protein